MSKKLFVALILLTVSLCLRAQPAFAHVLIRDESNTIGAVLHVTPDDDPIAGTPAELYFSLEGKSLEDSSVRMEIIDQSTGKSTLLTTTKSDSSIDTTYTFPSRGVYDIRLKITGDKTYTFSYSQRVSRGIGEDTFDESHPFAKAVLVVSSVALVVTTLFFINRWRDIFSQSSF